MNDLVSRMTEARWQTLMNAIGLPPSLDCYAAVYAAYAEPDRFYHTNQHIEAMLRHFDLIKHESENPNLLELAIWFHDAVYKPLSKTNELDSANWANDFLLAQGVDQSDAEQVYNLIMATLHHGEVATTDEKLLVDIDLTILGAAPEVYDQFEKNVRKEYRLIPSFIYRRKRKAILNSFLEKPSIYNLDYFKDRFENKARGNLTRAIGYL